ncbi:hypothetical protein RJ640_019145 [Escallonia rubra]|uniref:Homeobox-leucine zipper protein n=1 Tax=Escallonia rubra TaxID=112253 RepID=A0AA88S2G7_9ASTE|nr:hypothetical protein RJ640_019145 [Escallonia rubra]
MGDPSPTPATGKIESSLHGMEAKGHHRKNITKSRKRQQKRFSDEQIRSLEIMFETESRPELPLKQQLANQLGLKPRQVAIWFQNKRARSKSRQIEGDYQLLKINYDSLASEFESLKKENQLLLSQLQMLRCMVEKKERTQTIWLDLEGRGRNEEYQNWNSMLGTEENSILHLENHNHKTDKPSSDENDDPLRYLADSYLTSSGN